MKHLMQFYINGVPEKASDSLILKVDSQPVKIQDHPKRVPFLEVFLPIFFALNMVENIGLQEATDSQGADVPIAVVSSNFETNSSRHLGLGMGDTDVETSKPWYG